MATKKLISDWILYDLAGGVPHPSLPVHEEDIWVAIGDTVNSLFKLKQFDTNLPSGETMPEHAMIATYENIAVTSFGSGKSKATLPITPISLPKNMGIYLIYDPNHPESPFIPLSRGQLSLLRADELLNDLMGSIGYEPRNKDIIFTKDLTMFGISSVYMELCVLEISEYGINDELPIPADYIDRVKIEILDRYRGVLAKSGIVNNFTNPTQQAVK